MRKLPVVQKSRVSMLDDGDDAALLEMMMSLEGDGPLKRKVEEDPSNPYIVSHHVTLCA